MKMFWNDLRYSWRVLCQQSGFTLVAVVTLALGIGANTAIFTVVRSVLLRPLPYDQSEAIVHFVDTQHGRQLNSSYPNVLDWRHASRSFSAIAIYNPYTSVTLTLDGQAEVVPAAYAEGRLFSLLGVRPVAGRTFTADEEKKGAELAALISHRLWKSRFGGDAAMIGQQVGTATGGFRVVGVLPPNFSLDPADIWYPLAPRLSGNALDRGNHGGFRTLGRLKEGVSLAQAQAEMNHIAMALEAAYPAENRDLRVNLVPLQESQVGHLRGTMNLLWGAVGLVLLIACANVASLVLARHISREREVAIRAALGASQTQLLRLFFCESLVLALMGGSAGVLLAMWTADALPLVWSAPAAAGGVRIDGTVLLYSAGLTLLTAVLFGLLPGWQASRGWAGAVLRQHSGTVGVAAPKQRIRRALVSLDVAICLVLLAGAGAMVRTFYRLSEVDPGFRAEELLAVQISESGKDWGDLPALHRQVREEIGSLPGVVSVAHAWPFSYMTFSWTPKINFHENPLPDGEETMVETAAVTPEYFATMGIPLKRGRGIEPADRSGTRIVAVVSEEFARRFWPGQDPLGRRLRMIGIPELQDLEVVGVAGNTLRSGPAGKTFPEIYCAFDQFPTTGGTLLVRMAGDPALSAPAVREKLKSAYPGIAVMRSSTMREVMAGMLRDRSLVRIILGVFAIVALTLAAVGIYGAVASSVAQRTREIGVRLALGARPGGILRLMMVQGLAPVLVGVAAGTAAAYVFLGYLKGLVFGVPAYDPVSLVTSSLVLFAASFLACWIPARRAARVDPMVALRYE